MDGRYFEFIDRLKRRRADDEERTRLRSEMASLQTFNLHIVGSNPTGGILPTVYELTPRSARMFVVIDKHDPNQCWVKCPCGKEFSDWTTLWHKCPECGATDKGV